FGALLRRGTFGQLLRLAAQAFLLFGQPLAGFGIGGGLHLLRQFVLLFFDLFDLPGAFDRLAAKLFSGLARLPAGEARLEGLQPALRLHAARSGLGEAVAANLLGGLAEFVGRRRAAGLANRLFQQIDVALLRGVVLLGLAHFLRFGEQAAEFLRRGGVVAQGTIERGPFVRP